jgi:CubicO group peptidase (beta-lactamase class C family)
MKMVDQNVLNIDTPLYKYMPYEDIAYDERYKLITARMVLTHSTGFPNWRFYYPDNKLFIQFTPGTDFCYSGEGYVYLAKVIAHLTGVEYVNLDSLIQEEVCIPLGIKHTYFSGNDYISKHKAIGYIDGKITDDIWDRTAFNSAASLHSEAREYSKFLIAVMNETGLNSETVQQMLKEQIIILKDEGFKSDGYYSWALGFGIKKIANKYYYAHGGNNWNFQSHFLFDKDRKNGYVFFTNCNNGSEFNKKLEKFLTE